MYYEFGKFQVDPRKRLLFRDGVPVSLTPRAFDMLLLLVEGSGQLISKEELLNELWGDSHVAEANLTQTIFMLRKALGETASDQRYIFTVPGRGYRFAADVRQALPNEKPVDGTIAPAYNAPRHPGKKPAIGRLATALLAAIGAIVILIALRRDHSPAQPVTTQKTILAVLPFENLTGDGGQDYFSDGLTEEMIIQLERADPQHLQVIASTSAMHHKDAGANLQQLGQKLGVQYLLEGSVRRDANYVRISAKLIQTRDQTYRWAKQYDRKLTNLLALQSEIARDIADQIQLTLGGGHERREPVPSSHVKYEAYDLYLKGRYFWNKRTPQSFLQAIDYFQKATQADPNYARAYAGLADSYSLYSGYSFTPAKDSMSRAREAAARAVALDDNLAEAHTSLAVIAQNYDYDWKTAEREYRRAIELDTNYATAHHWYGEYLGLQGRFNEAFAEMGRARRLDPLSVIMAADNAVLLYYSRNYDQAIRQFRSVLEMEPNFPRAHMLVYAYTEKGMFAEAFSDAEKCCRLDDTFARLSLRGYIYGRSGQVASAHNTLKELKEFYQRGHTDPMFLSFIYIATGEKDQALLWIERAYAERSSNLTNIKVSPLYDPLRTDPRFQSILNRMGLAE